MKIKAFVSAFISKFGSLFKKNKKLFIFCLIAVVIGLFFLMPSKDKDESQEKNESLINQSMLTENYASAIENKIKQMLLAVGEVKEADVMIVCDSSEMIEYLKNKTETTSGSGDSTSKTVTEEVVYEKNGSISSPIIVKKNMPKVVGVWIVINEVSPSTKLAITNSVCSVLNIDESRINILQER